MFLKNGREMGGRIARWALALGEYDYEIQYIKGSDNTLADVLSRMVAAESRGTHGNIVDQDTAEKHTLATMTPSIAAAVSMYHHLARKRVPVVHSRAVKWSHGREWNASSKYFRKDDTTRASTSSASPW